MLYHEQSEDYRPLFWMGGRPIYAHILLLVGHILACGIMALCMSFFGAGRVANDLSLDTDAVIYHGEIWRLFSYVIFPPSLLFIFALGFFYFSSREVEQFVGRSTYLKLYAALVLIPAISSLRGLDSSGPNITPRAVGKALFSASLSPLPPSIRACR